MALDWMNGRRTPDANQNLKGAIIGLTLGPMPRQFSGRWWKPPPLVQKPSTTVSSAKESGSTGSSHWVVWPKNRPLSCRVVADVLNRPIKVARSEQACALGSAMAAAVAAGIYANTAEAQANMGGGIEKEYLPDPVNAAKYEALYEQYKQFGEWVGAGVS